MDNSRKTGNSVSRSVLQGIFAAELPIERERLLHIHWQQLREKNQANSLKTGVLKLGQQGRIQ